MNTDAMSDRNRIARECADLRDQRDDLLRVIADLKDHNSIIDDDRRLLGVITTGAGAMSEKRVR